jgi:hypothetical protein
MLIRRLSIPKLMKPTNAGGDLTDETRSASTVMVLSGSRVEIMLACGGGAELLLGQQPETSG